MWTYSLFVIYTFTRIKQITCISKIAKYILDDILTTNNRSIMYLTPIELKCGTSGPISSSSFTRTLKYSSNTYFVRNENISSSSGVSWIYFYHQLKYKNFIVKYFLKINKLSFSYFSLGNIQQEYYTNMHIYCSSI